jgi:hypothetical protein
MLDLRRRDFIALLGGAAAAWPLAARAQQPIGRTGKMPRVGVLMPGPAAHSTATLKPFYQGLHELGYIEGQNLAIERRDGDWKPDRLPELVGLKVDIIVAWSTPPQYRFEHIPRRNRSAPRTSIGNILLRKMIPDAFPLLVREVGWSREALEAADAKTGFLVWVSGGRDGWATARISAAAGTALALDRD